ncbi:MAG TPA: NAD-dependent epimerase/dehydratase family protein, partial [Terriglobales bacterium]
MNPLAEDLSDVLSETKPLWEELRNARIFITGGTGFFGCWLLETFAWANEHLSLNARAVVLTREAEKFRRKAPHLADLPAVYLHEGDVRDFDFPSGDFTHAVHAAAESSTTLNSTHPHLMLDTIVRGTQRCLDFAKAKGVKKFLFVSSGAVYGAQPAGLSHIPETYSAGPEPLAPESAYAEGKRMAELQCALAANSGVPETKIARCFAFVGPYLPLDAHFAIGNFIR